eukprot:Polyplicarium_translucidae@DN2069_c0_g1_i2.p1
MTTVAVFGGSFDPPTLGHLFVVNELLAAGACDEVWLVPCGARPDKVLIASGLDRLTMLEIAVEDYFASDHRTTVTPIEIHNGSAIPTLELMRRLQRERPEVDFRFVVGSDLVDQLKDWTNGHALLEEVHFLVIPRPGGIRVPSSCPKRMTYLAPLLGASGFTFCSSGVSSTEVRKRLPCGTGGCRALVPRRVLEYIAAMGLYGCGSAN